MGALLLVYRKLKMQDFLLSQTDIGTEEMKKPVILYKYAGSQADEIGKAFGNYRCEFMKKTKPSADYDAAKTARDKKTGRKPQTLWLLPFLFILEVTGFEPATFWSRTKRATKLRYTSLQEANEGTRTPDLRFTKPLLYRLSYVGKQQLAYFSTNRLFLQ